MEPLADLFIENQHIPICVPEIGTIPTQPPKSLQVYIAKGRADAVHLPAELAHLGKIFAYKGFSKKEMDRVIASHGKQKLKPSVEDVIKGVVVIPYYRHVTKEVSLLLWCKGMKIISLPQTKIRHVL